MYRYGCHLFHVNEKLHKSFQKLLNQQRGRVRSSFEQRANFLFENRILTSFTFEGVSHGFGFRFALNSGGSGSQPVFNLSLNSQVMG